MHIQSDRKTDIGVVMASGPKPARRGYLELPLKRLSWLGRLGAHEEEAIRALDQPRRRIGKGEDMGLAQPESFYFVLDGWGCKERRLPDGRRQIFELILPGDIVGCLPGETTPPRYGCTALTDIVMTDAGPLAQVQPDGRPAFPGIVGALAAYKRQGHERLLDQIVRMGARKAYDSIGHLMLEVFERQSEVGLAQGARFPFLIGQERLGDLLGLSAVHVNRTMTQLKKDGHVVFGPGWIALPNIKALAELVAYPVSERWHS